MLSFCERVQEYTYQNMLCFFLLLCEFTMKVLWKYTFNQRIANERMIEWTIENIICFSSSSSFFSWKKNFSILAYSMRVKYFVQKVKQTSKLTGMRKERTCIYPPPKKNIRNVCGCFFFVFFSLHDLIWYMHAYVKFSVSSFTLLHFEFRLVYRAIFLCRYFFSLSKYYFQNITQKQSTT